MRMSELRRRGRDEFSLTPRRAPDAELRGKPYWDAAKRAAVSAILEDGFTSPAVQATRADCVVALDEVEKLHRVEADAALPDGRTGLTWRKRVWRDLRRD